MSSWSVLITKAQEIISCSNILKSEITLYMARKLESYEYAESFEGILYAYVCICGD